MGHLVELLDGDKSTHSTYKIAAFLSPYWLVVVSESSWKPHRRAAPFAGTAETHLLAVFARVEVPEPSPEKTRRLLLARAVEVAGRFACEPSPNTDAGLASLDRLYRRYATYSA